jgi:predicted ester cyclase
MGNGAIVTFLGETDNQALLDDGERNKAILNEFYRRVWNEQDLDAIESFIAPGFAIHREGEVRHGVDALREMIFVTQVNFDDLAVQIEALTSLGDMVAYRLSVSYTDVRDGQSKRVRGICLCRLSGDQIAESSVTYLPEDVGSGGLPSSVPPP